MLKAKNLRDQSLEELEATYSETCKKLYDLNNQRRLQRKNENPHEIRHVRKDIARLLTVITEKQQGRETQQSSR